MKRFVIVAKKRGAYVVPVIETRDFNSPKKLGSYCAEDGSLWVSLNDGERIFEDESLAKIQLSTLIGDLFKDEAPR